MTTNERNNQEKSKRDDQINAKDFLIGALLGGIVGAATALFFAPKSGRELVNDINNQAMSLKEKSGQFRETALTKGSELASVVKGKSIELSDVVSRQSSEMYNKVKQSKSDLKEGFVNEHKEREGIILSEFSKSNNEIQKMLEDTKKAFDDTESKYNQ